MVPGGEDGRRGLGFGHKDLAAKKHKRRKKGNERADHSAQVGFVRDLAQHIFLLRLLGFFAAMFCLGLTITIRRWILRLLLKTGRWGLSPRSIVPTHRVTSLQKATQTEYETRRRRARLDGRHRGRRR